jgi:hypothetical protein
MRRSAPCRARLVVPVAFLAFLLLPGTLARAQTPGDQAGVFASGSVSYIFRICSTCPEPTGVLESQSDGAFGSFGPAIVGGLGAGGDGEGSFGARALIRGPDGVPELRANARAAIGIGPHPGFSEDGVYEFNVPATARGVQYYSYTGTTTQTYTMDYTISGFAGSLLPAPTPDDEALIGISGGLTLFDDKDKLGGELPMGRVVDIDRISVDGTAHDFRLSGSVSITLNPGDDYYLAAFLAAQVSPGGHGIADAGNTLEIAFSAGDTSQLTPLLPAVPEPSTYALMGIGLIFVGLMARRRC